MTRAGGKTTRFRRGDAEEAYEIAIAIDMLFDGFSGDDRSVTVCGISCDNRIEALQKIFEHELVHLAELLCWGESDCAAGGFRDIAMRVFLHRAHTHELITPVERAVNAGIRAGSRVPFTIDGNRLNRTGKSDLQARYGAGSGSRRAPVLRWSSV
jgi:hypothetical protein